MKYISKSFAALNLILALILTSMFVSVFAINPAEAETGKGTDVFRVIMTIFGADKSKSDVVGVVTVNNGEASKVKFLDIDKLQSSLATTPPSTTNPAPGDEGIIEYVATFPNVTVNAGDEYKACVLPLRNLGADSMLCTTGHNSPAARPEFVDISLNATTTAA